MIVTAHQPAYFPWLGYIHKIAMSDIFVILDNVQFEKNSFTNRNKIYSSQGELMLTVPIQMKGHIGKPIKEIRISNSENWRKKHLISILQSYRKAPFFDYYAAWLESIYSKEWDFLIDLTNEMLFFLIKEMNIKTKIIRQSDTGIISQKQDLVIDLCKFTKANLYISGALGKDYIDINTFKQAQIDIYFQNYQHPIYPQVGKHGFLSKLGIIDLLMNVGSKKAFELIMTGNQFKNKL
jgi:hypothetical protein